MSLGRFHLAFLLAPLAVLTAAAAWWFGMGWVKPGANISERGHEELLYSALFAAMVALVAVPAAAVRLIKRPELRNGRNIAATLAGAIPIPVAALIWLALLIAL